MTDTPITKRISAVNRNAVKRYALHVAASSRAHKFTRVATSFLDDVEARVESAIRRIVTYSLAPLPSNEKLVTKVAVEKFREVIETQARAIVNEKVRQQPSAGKTLV